MAGTSDGGIWSVVPYGAFTAYTPALPQFYWDVYSAEQRIKHICYEIDKIIAYADMLGVNLNSTHDDVVELQEELQNLKDGGLLDYYEKQIYAWIQANMAELMKASIRQVYFGLTDDSYSGGAGYFVAYIPESWNEIVFDTGADPEFDTYGRLILRWDADSPYTVEQPPEHSFYSDTSIIELINNVKETADNAMSLAETNEKDIALTEADVTEVQSKLENVTKISKGTTYDQIADTGYLYDEGGNQ